MVTYSFPPESISTALSMTYAAQAGDTAVQMGKVLHLNLAPDDLASPSDTHQAAQRRGQKRSLSTQHR